MSFQKRINNVLEQAPLGANLLDVLIASGLDKLPMPASGGTLSRWQALATVAQFDLSLAKHYEGHTDALAIMNEIGSIGGVASTGVQGA